MKIIVFKISGGRVLNIVTKSSDLKLAREKSLKLLTEINWENGFYRKDIGYKVIKEWELYLGLLKEKKF